MNNLPAMITDLKPSGALVDMLKAPMEAVYSTDKNPVGCDMRELPWVCPEYVSKATKLEAARLLASAEEALKKAPKSDIQEWLTTLGVLQANKMSVEDAVAKLSAYSTLLDHPSACFNRITLDAVSREFKPWFPDYGGLADFLDGYARPLRQMVDRLRRIAEAPEPLPKPAPVRETEEEIKAGVQKVWGEAYKNAGMDVPEGELSADRFYDELAKHQKQEDIEDAATIEERTAELVKNCEGVNDEG